MVVSKCNFFIFLVLSHYCYAYSFNYDYLGISEECDEDVFTVNENGALDIYSSLTRTVKFLYITPNNETIELNSTNLDMVNTTNPTKLIIHGLGNSENITWIDQMAYLYHTKGDYNIIAVDWSKISVKHTDYIISIVDDLGNVVGHFIMEIVETDSKYLSNVHLIGSSLGAQIGAVAAETIAKTKGQKLGRITALNPSVFNNSLDSEDAEFVDVIHSSVTFGQSKCGTVDFYITANDTNRAVCYNDTCGQLIAEDYFMRSIVDGDRFQGYSCYNASYAVRRLCDKAEGIFMGEYVPRNITGSFLISTDTAAGIFINKSFILSCSITLILWYLCA